MEMTKTILLISAVIIGTVYCTTYGDGSVYGEFNVHCDDTSLVVFFNKTALDERTTSGYNNRSYVIKWNGSSNYTECTTDGTDFVASSFGSLSSDGGYASTIYMKSEFGADMERCGVNVYSDNDYIYYNNTITITYGQNPNGLIGREEYDKYHVTCYRNRTVEEKLAGDKYDVQSRVDGEETKNNTAEFSFTFTHTDMNDQVQSTYKLGDYIKFKMVLDSISDTKAVIQKCWATSDGTINEYALISNRCDLEEQTRMTTATNKETVFNTEAFRFLPSGNSVYVECLVRVCLGTDGSQECTLCPTSKRRRRAITGDGEESNEALEDPQITKIRSPTLIIIDGESVVVPAEKSPQQQESFLSGTNGLIIVILVAVFVFVICAAVIKKVFFSRSVSQVVIDAPVAAYHNKALA